MNFLVIKAGIHEGIKIKREIKIKIRV